MEPEPESALRPVASSTTLERSAASSCAAPTSVQEVMLSVAYTDRSSVASVTGEVSLLASTASADEVPL